MGMVAKTILCVTGTRADYGIYRPLLYALDKDPYFSLKLVATGMHLLPEYGMTVEAIRKDGFSLVATPSILFRDDTTVGMSQTVGVGTLYFAELFQREKPDAVLLLGDRGEMLAAAIASHYQNIPSVHLHGGEQSGSADDNVRHAISKLSMYHFTATEKSKERLIDMGEIGDHVAVSGSLRKHDMEALRLEKASPLLEQVKGWKKRRLLVLAVHPDSKGKLDFDEQVQRVIEGVVPFQDWSIVCIGPNSDAGGQVFRRHLSGFVKRYKHVHYKETLSSNEYLYLLSQADVLVGNTSSGIIEAPFFSLPFVNVGERQRNRECGQNVIHVDYDGDAIAKAIKEAASLKLTTKDNPYDVVSSPALFIVEQMKQWI
ncbi:UDP-N-acetylglucosamine 2-epimerase [Alteribacter aurantiacus]|uniref:UDP-N-acetylglucosamine 2-epimerase n=1 Tax=Alteribacter aurantiacus TaxID=254410 RepID=UPI001FDF6636|nr:UDP-N-acetylglucosamine 2-epimerase [Alteribacter aurantiacus]